MDSSEFDNDVVIVNHDDLINDLTYKNYYVEPDEVEIVAEIKPEIFVVPPVDLLEIVKPEIEAEVVIEAAAPVCNMRCL